jgi:GR25 family glycosyltransferase involved in LPS biosynthesis
LSFVETRQKSIQLGSSRVGVTYPRTLDRWFDDLVMPPSADVNASKWVHLRASAKSGYFDVFASVNAPAKQLDLGEALVTFWERVSFLLVADLRDAMVLHAAALCRENCFVLMPGRSGSGKTRLSLWYRAQGFELATDEIVSASVESNGIGTLAGALARPVIVKSLIDLTTLLSADEVPLAQQDSSCGLILKLKDSGPRRQRVFDRGLIVFPHFTVGASLSLTALTPGEASLNLLENCLNVRNLRRGGLPVAAGLARSIPAISLLYGQTTQLNRTLDVLTRQVFATRPSAEDLTDLCQAFTARGAARGGYAVMNDKTAQPTSIAPVIPAPTAQRFPRRLTIGIATCDECDGVYFTIQSILINNPELDRAVEFVVIDNNPGGRCSEALSNFGKSIDGYRYIPRGELSGAAIRSVVFEEASSPYVLCIDSHVLIVPGAVSKLIEYFEANPHSRDLVQGPMICGDLRKTATHMDPRWRDGKFGTWAEDPRGTDPTAPAFEIPMHDLGLFACSRTAWPGFHSKFRGFGGEEGYIHEKFRQRGGRTLCLPFLRWLNRFCRPIGTLYVSRWEDRIRNYLIGFSELGLDTAEMEAHFAEIFGAETSARILSKIKLDLGLLHTGQLISRRGDAGRPNAGDLSGQPQFGAATRVLPRDTSVGARARCRVKLLGDWASSSDLVAAFGRQSKGDGRWNEIELTTNDAADYYALFNRPGVHGDRFVPERTIVIPMEPPCAVATWGEWASPDPRGFVQVRSHDRFPNCGEWYLGLSWSELRNATIAKDRDLSAVVSSKCYYPGHILRIAFLRSLEANGTKLDIFGYDNLHGFRAYVGSLPFRDKSRGLLPYRYTIAIENSSYANYYTEKVLDALLAECLPFYWGCPNLDNYIDPRAFIRLPLEDLDASCRMVDEAIANSEWSRRIDVIRREKRRILDELQLFPMLARVIRGHRFSQALGVKVINLDRRPDRLESFRHRLAEVTSPNLASRVQRFSAIDGRTLSLTSEIQHIFRGNDFGYRRGVIGCALSHLALWKELAVGDVPGFLILEDDVTLCPGFDGQLVELCGELVECQEAFDLLFLGYHDWQPEDVAASRKVARLGRIEGPRYIGGTFAYILSRRGAQRLLAIVERDGIQNAIDVFVYWKQTELEIFSATPHIAWSRIALPHSGIDSDIQHDFDTR